MRPIVAFAYRGVFVKPLPGNALTCHNIKPEALLPYERYPLQESV
jgi:hypothetical protein